MLNIFADALLIAARLGRLPADDSHATRTRLVRDRFHDVEDFAAPDARRNQAR